MDVGLVIGGTDLFVRPIEHELSGRYSCTRFAPRFVRMPLVGSRLNSWLLDLQLQSFTSRNDVVLFEWASSLLVRTTGLPKRGRVVARCHSGELATAASQVRWDAVDAVIVLNEAHCRRLQRIAGDSMPPVSIINNGVDLRRFAPVERGFQYRLGMVCSLSPRKRVYEVLLCLHRLRQLGLPATLRVAGTMPENAEGEARLYPWALENLIAQLGLSEAVRLCGHVADVAGWLQDVDVFISNSYWEGQQIALLEAMASGCYCLSHCWEGVEEILPEANVYVTESDFCDKLVRYCALPSVEKARCQAGMRALAVERFDQRRMVEGVVALLAQVATIRT